MKVFDRGYFKKFSASYRTNRHCCVYTVKIQALVTNINVQNLPIAASIYGHAIFSSNIVVSSR